GVSSPRMIASRSCSSAASAIVRWRTAVDTAVGRGSTEPERESHLIRCQTRGTIASVRSGRERAPRVLGEGRGLRPARRGEGMTASSKRIALLVVAVAASVLAGTAGARTHAATPIVIGWAYDGKGAMAPFDGPALAAAKIRVDQLNAKGGVDGRHLVI